MPLQRSPLVRGLAVVAACGLAAISFAVTAVGSDDRDSGLEALARALLVATPLFVGLFLLGQPPLRRFGWMLLVAGGGWFLTTLAGSDDPLLYSIGRVAGWALIPWVIYVTLAYPSGWLQTRADRALVAAAVAGFATLFLPSVLLVEHYPDPSPWSFCSADCPANAFMLTGHEPAWVGDVLQPLRDLLTVALLVAVALRLAQRVRAASPVMRQMLTPVLQAASLRCVVGAVILVTRVVAPDQDALVRAGWALGVLASIAVSLSFLVGALRWRLFVGERLVWLAGHIRAESSPAALRDVLADAFQDPALELRRPPDGDGEPPPGRVRTEIREDGEVVAVVVHDPALRDEPAFVEAVGAVTLLQELRESRARVLAGADDERQRIQRDLHDGAQQRLVALRVRLDLTAAGHTEVGSDALRAVAREVEAAIEETRDFVQGVYPPLLAARGLVDALRSAATRMPLATRVVADGIPRYPETVERAGYFCALEAMQNAAKHAQGATRVTVRIVDDGVLRVDVHDDGGGFDVAAAAPGVGLTSIRDRVASIGGELALESRPQDGTRVVITLPRAA
jgi:signal transduction histidine kinase